MATLDSPQPEAVPIDWTHSTATAADRAAVDEFNSRFMSVMADLRSCPENVREAATPALHAVETQLKELQRWVDSGIDPKSNRAAENAESTGTAD